MKKNHKLAVTRTLSLSRETLRSLQHTELRAIAGGFSGDNSCYPVLCNIDSDPCP